MYVAKLFGTSGQFILASIVSLACLTTAVGLTSACADFFHSLLPRLSYRTLVIGMSALCALIANVGLSALIALSIPVLVAIYPIAVVLVLMTLLKERFTHPRLAFRFVMLIALLFGSLDGLKVIGINLELFNFLPLFEVGLAWLLPTAVAVIACLCWRVESDLEAVVAE